MSQIPGADVSTAEAIPGADVAMFHWRPRAGFMAAELEACHWSADCALGSANPLC